MTSNSFSAEITAMADNQVPTPVEADHSFGLATVIWFRLLVRLATSAAIALLIPLGTAHAQDAPVTTYHNGNNRAGNYVVLGLTLLTAPQMHRDTAFDGRFKGHVYAQPLYWRAPGAASGQVIVATESNHVVALNASTGAMVWNRSLGPVIPGNVLPCGNISPLGITGTPVIDHTTGSLFLVAELDRQGSPAVLAFGLSLQDGSDLPGWPVDIAAGLAAQGLSFSPNVQGQRSALTFHDGKLYVPFGGRLGDCGDYHGWVVGLQLTPPGVINAWQTRAQKGGIWSVGGAAIADNDIYVATGNTSGATSWGDGEAIIRLRVDLQHTTTSGTYFSPRDWRDLDAQDLDLGGTNPMPFDIKGRRLILALGKDGKARLLDRTELGGIGGAVAERRVSPGAIITGPASWRRTGPSSRSPPAVLPVLRVNSG